MKNNDFNKVLNLLDICTPLTLEQIKVLQKILDSDAREMGRTNSSANELLTMMCDYEEFKPSDI